MPGLQTNQTVQHDTTNFPAVARDLQRIEHDRAALFEEYRRLILLDDDAVGDDERRRFSEIVSILGIDTTQLARDAELIGKVRELEAKIPEAERWEREEAKIQKKIDALPTKDSGIFDKLDSDLRTAQLRGYMKLGTLRRNIGDLKRSRRGSILYGLEPLHPDPSKTPLPSGAVRLG